MAQETTVPKPTIHRIPTTKLRSDRPRNEKDSRLWEKHIKQQSQKSK